MSTIKLFLVNQSFYWCEAAHACVSRSTYVQEMHKLARDCFAIQIWSAVFGTALDPAAVGTVARALVHLPLDPDLRKTQYSKFRAALLTFSVPEASR